MKNAIVTAGTVSVRTGRSEDDPAVGEFKGGTKIVVLDDALDQDYARVIWQEGYAYSGGGTHIRWFEFGGNQRFHMQAGDLSRTHVEKNTHFAFSADDLDAVLAELQAKGYAWSDMKGTPGAINVRPDGMRAVFLQDPNGYWIEINDFR